jgi:hypothetical protein
LSANDARVADRLDDARREPGVLAELAQRNDRRQFGTRHDSGDPAPSVTTAASPWTATPSKTHGAVTA